MPAQLDRIQRTSLFIGAVAAAICLAGAIHDPQQFFRSYLMAYIFWSGIALGSLATLMLHHLVGGGWGFLIRRTLESAAATFPLLALLAVPILIGIPYLYIWAHPDAVAHDPLLQHKHIYLNVPFFVARAAIYFGLWTLLAYVLNKWFPSDQDRRDSPSVARRLYNLLSGPGLVLYGLTATLASLDWVMCRSSPDWFSCNLQRHLHDGPSALRAVLRDCRPYAAGEPHGIV